MGVQPVNPLAEAPFAQYTHDSDWYVIPGDAAPSVTQLRKFATVAGTD